MTTTGVNVDLESVLFEAREILSALSHVSRAQTAAIERLGGAPYDWSHALELQERANAAADALNVVLNTLALGPSPAANDDDGDSEPDMDAEYEAHFRSTIEQWRSETLKMQEQLHLEVGHDQHDQYELHDELSFDPDHRESTPDDEEEEEEEVAGNISFSTSSSFWKSDEFDWAAEEFEEDTSSSILNVPELMDDNGRFDATSESGDSSFTSADMNACAGIQADREEKVTDEDVHHDEVAELLSQTMTLGSRRFIRRDRTVSFNVLANMDVNLGAQEKSSKATPVSTFSKTLANRKSSPHLRRLARLENLPMLLAVDE